MTSNFFTLIFPILQFKWVRSLRKFHKLPVPLTGWKIPQNDVMALKASDRLTDLVDYLSQFEGYLQLHFKAYFLPQKL